jgi:hypothetical protein
MASRGALNIHVAEGDVSDREGAEGDVSLSAALAALADGCLHFDVRGAGQGLELPAAPDRSLGQATLWLRDAALTLPGLQPPGPIGERGDGTPACHTTRALRYALYGQPEGRRSPPSSPSSSAPSPGDLHVSVALVWVAADPPTEPNPTGPVQPTLAGPLPPSPNPDAAGLRASDFVARGADTHPAPAPLATARPRPWSGPSLRWTRHPDPDPLPASFSSRYPQRAGAGSIRRGE